MPYVHITSPSGPAEIHYHISTPVSQSSQTINAHLPCVLFLHSGYVAQEVFEAQFSDSLLRNGFNLIGLDMRAYGTTKGLIGNQNYSPTDSAEDVHSFIKALRLPPVHVFGLALGCCIALELAAAHPDLVLSLVLCSPLASNEPEEIAEGRLEVFQYWSQAFNHNASTDPMVEKDDAILEHMLRGCQQLCFNNQTNSLTEALTKVALMQAINNRAGSPEKLSVSYKASIGWFLNRIPITLERLAMIRSPVRLIHCSEDFAYPLHFAQELEAQLREAGVPDVALCQVPGPHYGNVTNPQPVNDVLYDLVLSMSSEQTPTTRFASPERSRDRHKMATPYTKKLSKYGYDPHEDDSDMELL